MTNAIQYNGRWLFKFNSQGEQIDYVDPANFKKFETQTKSFVGEDLKRWEDVKAMAKSAWKIGLETLDAYIERLSKEEIPLIKSSKRKFVYATEGDELDVERMAAGEAKCWKKYTRQKSTGPTSATIIVDTTTACGYDSMDILWRGAAAIALLKVLEDKGYSVELWVINGSSLFMGDPSPVMTACCLKKTSDPLDLGTIINTVSGWFYRTETFTLLETICQKHNKMTAYGLGSCYYPDEDDLDKLTTDSLRVYSSGVFTFNGALDLMKSQLEKVFKGKGEDGGEKK